jgi:DNA-binding LacI/PurR family transcriptional regulator
VQLVVSANPGAQIVHETGSLRPSFLSGFKAVVDFDPGTPATFLRDLVVRNAIVVVVGREPHPYSISAVLADRTLGASKLARDLMLAGHRRFLAVERRGSTCISIAIRNAAQRYAADATVDVAFPDEAVVAVEQGVTAVICDDVSAAREVAEAMRRLAIDIPGRASLAAVGTDDRESERHSDFPCTGYFVGAQEKADAIQQVLRDGAARRPTTLWLTGAYHDAGTTGPTDSVRRQHGQFGYGAASA